MISSTRHRIIRNLIKLSKKKPSFDSIKNSKRIFRPFSLLEDLLNPIKNFDDLNTRKQGLVKRTQEILKMTDNPPFEEISFLLPKIKQYDILNYDSFLKLEKMFIRNHKFINDVNISINIASNLLNFRYPTHNFRFYEIFLLEILS